MSQCTFWCSVLSDLWTGLCLGNIDKSQCTFWCSVLSDGETLYAGDAQFRLNAPFGAQCFPTEAVKWWARDLWVSMHLLVLSAFRQFVAFGPDR